MNLLLLVSALAALAVVYLSIESCEYSHRLPPPDTSGQSGSMSGIGNQ